MEQEANKILEQFKNGNITKDKARRLLFVLSGVSRSAYCKLDRVKEECSIIQNTSFKSCEGCGHFC
jgi:hypothetical protein